MAPDLPRHSLMRLLDAIDMRIAARQPVAAEGSFAASHHLQGRLASLLPTGSRSSTAGPPRRFRTRSPNLAQNCGPAMLPEAGSRFATAQRSQAGSHEACSRDRASVRCSEFGTQEASRHCPKGPALAAESWKIAMTMELRTLGERLRRRSRPARGGAAGPQEWQPRKTKTPLMA